jgi:hypothetical protein
MAVELAKAPTRMWVVYTKRGAKIGSYQSEVELREAFGTLAEISTCLEITHPMAPGETLVARSEEI